MTPCMIIIFFTIGICVSYYIDVNVVFANGLDRSRQIVFLVL